MFIAIFLSHEDLCFYLSSFEFYRKESGIDISKDAFAMQRLREAAEKAKRELDGLSATEISLPFVTADASGPKHLNLRLTKAKFESLVDHLVNKTLGPCKACLKDSGVKKDDLNDVLDLEILDSDSVLNLEDMDLDLLDSFATRKKPDENREIQISAC